MSEKGEHSTDSVDLPARVVQLLAQGAGALVVASVTECIMSNYAQGERERAIIQRTTRRDAGFWRETKQFPLKDLPLKSQNAT